MSVVPLILVDRYALGRHGYSYASLRVVSGTQPRTLSSWLFNTLFFFILPLPNYYGGFFFDYHLTVCLLSNLRCIHLSLLNGSPKEEPRSKGSS